METAPVSQLHDVVSGQPLNNLFDLDDALAMPAQPTTESNAVLSIKQLVESAMEKMPTVYPVRCSCTVCLEHIKPGIGGKRISCGHVYHSSCIATWLSTSLGSCPLCREEILYE